MWCYYRLSYLFSFAFSSSWRDKQCGWFWLQRLPQRRHPKMGPDIKLENTGHRGLSKSCSSKFLLSIVSKKLKGVFVYLQLATSFKTFLDNWNIQTALWLKRYIFVTVKYSVTAVRLRLCSHLIVLYMLPVGYVMSAVHTTKQQPPSCCLLYGTGSTQDITWPS